VTFRGIVKLAAITAVSGLFALYAAEFVVGEMMPRSGAFPKGIFVADADRGIAFAPGFDGSVTRVRRIHVSINAQGYRDSDWKKKSAPRVMLAGSSATVGLGLEANQMIGARLGEILGDVSVLNAGIYSYGPPQILSTIERECARWHPQVVVYMHEYKLTRRDFLVNRGVGGNANAAEDEKEASVASLRLNALRAFLSNHGLHPRQLAEKVFGFEQLSPTYLSAHYAATRPSSEFCADCAERTVRFIRAMKPAAEACGAGFVMAVLPGTTEAYYGLREPATDEVLSRLRSAEPNFPIVDLRNGIPIGSRFTIPALDYFNEQGVSWIVNALAGPIRQVVGR
jgi:hypothetical protein